MEIREFTFKGFISYEWDDNFQTIRLTGDYGSVDIVKKLRAIFDLFESEVSMSYFISDKESTENEIREGWLKQLYGNVRAEHETDSYNYSEYTYGTDYNTYLEVGGHDLFNEFSDYIGKYCILKVSVKVED